MESQEQRIEKEEPLASQVVRVAMIGLGTVGTGVAEFFRETEYRVGNASLEVIAVRDTKKPREVDVPRLTDDVDSLLENPEIDLIVELMGGESPAVDFIRRALANGKSVVTANKAVVSRYLPELAASARSQGVDLAFEAAVAGSIPVIRLLQGFKGERMQRIVGILNGTSNYILTRMEEGMTFSEALQQAQEKGFAEAEHSLDTGGFDARDKLAILASLAFDTAVSPESIYCEGITEVSSVDLDFASKYGVEEGEPGYVVRSLASVREKSDGSLELYVYPALVRKDHPLAAVREEMNAVYLEGERCGPQLYLGRGAGKEATASAVIADILRLAENRSSGVTDELPQFAQAPTVADPESLSRPGYIRMNLKHLPGNFAEAAAILGRHGFNILDSIQRRRFQKEVDGDVFIPDIVTMEELSYGEVKEGLLELSESNCLQGKPFFLRFEA